MSAAVLQALPGGPMVLLPLAFLLALAAFLALRVLGPRRERVRRERLRATWAREDLRRRRDRQAIAALHEALRGAPATGSPAALDLGEETAEDLDLEPVFAVLDRTLTEPGQQALHRLLRRPLLDAAALEERGRLIDLLQRDAGVRERLQLALLPLEGAAPGTLVPLLAPDRKLRLPLPAPVYTALALASLAAVGAWAALGAAGLLAVAGAYLLALAAHYGAEREVSSALPGITALQLLVAAARRLGALEAPGLEPALARLRERLAALGPLLRALAGLGAPPAADDLALYFEIFFLRQVRLLARAAPLLAARRAELLALAEEVGTLDALQAVASFREERRRWCAPRLDPAATALEAEELRHPLLPEAVPNSIALGGGALITGSNMSGKSTFLRTVGINALLAQTVFTCTAARWSGPLLRLATSLRRSDSLLAGRSYYLAEAQGILAALRAAETPPRTLCIFDEIFRGTNTAERVAAATEVLRWLAARGALVLAATHDDALTRLLEGPYRNLHFGEAIAAGGLAFDYRLAEGPATTRNAIELLRFLGYPEELVAAARARSAGEDRDAPPAR